MSNSNRMNQFLGRMLRKSEEEEIFDEIQYFDRAKLRRIILSRRNTNRNSCESANQSSLLSRKSSFSRQSRKKLGSSCELGTKPIKDQSPKSLIRPTPAQSLNISSPHNTPTRMESMRKAKTLPASLSNSPHVEQIVEEFESGFMSPRSDFEPGSGNFVKRIVAAFEEKCKTYNDSWSDKVREKLKDSGLHRHSYSNICQSLQFASAEISESSTDTSSTKSSSNEALKIEYRSSAPAMIVNEQNVQFLERISNCHETDNVSVEMNEDSTLKRKERAPIIIGAFLKKPVKVEEISINWIPFPGKKLPRKKSLKKLLSALSGKKSSEKKKDVVFSSQVNINDDNRELPDSGYDEQSVSSSSLTSITSAQDVITREQKREERIYANISAVGNWSRVPNYNRKSTNLSTFQNQGPDEVDDESSTHGNRKILLYEIPREEVKVDLGPCYPSPTKIMVKSLDRKFHTKLGNVLPSLPKHPMSSKIPKHPFISTSKDELNVPTAAAPDDDDEDENGDDENDNDDDDDRNEEVVFRKPREHLSSFHSSENEYDVPRKYLSRSEPGISEVLRFSFDLCLDEMHNYDVPKLRPKSSVYEDALSLKRRNADFVNAAGSSQDYYSSPSPPQYATIKSRNKRYLSPEVFKSADELRSNSMKVTSF